MGKINSSFFSFLTGYKRVARCGEGEVSTNNLTSVGPVSSLFTHYFHISHNRPCFCSVISPSPPPRGYKSSLNKPFTNCIGPAEVHGIWF